MKFFSTLLLSFIVFGVSAQTTITNGGFELWGNTIPAGDTHTEPTNWYSNQSGSPIASLGPQTCFKDGTVVHSGSYSVRIETVSGPVSTVIGGTVTTGVIDAPTINSSDSYIGTVNYSTSTDIRRMSFTGRPDSIVGWYQYLQGGSGEIGQLRAILHTDNYYDPETPTTYHPDPTADKIADALFTTPASNVTTWTRFSIPFNYVSTSAPTYIMINAHSSAGSTSHVGTKFWLDDLQVTYNSTTGIDNVTILEQNVNIYSADKTAYVNFINGNETTSSFSIFDMAGRKVFSTEMISNKLNSCNLSGLNSGVYVYHLSNSDFCKTGKLFIK